MISLRFKADVGIFERGSERVQAQVRFLPGELTESLPQLSQAGHPQRHRNDAQGFTNRVLKQIGALYLKAEIKKLKYINNTRNSFKFNLPGKVFRESLSARRLV